ncbi:MFS transporter [Nocardioides marmoribigeumensis]|uniref:MFS family arabinose efflux permease n=1 Tax=Nocardioides marmoribigeumensis TaxID=433649 RepID=A0ABU2BRH9_9ACTN|nr:MFS transporter [Nocardioides marmoribigeumensis]MDR7360876.1 putative MFS family arabinose efflux permease [Nocardioides marmoribigeumensis]
MTTKPTLRSSLRHRDYRLFIGAFTTSCIGSWAYNVALAVWLIEATGSAGWVAGSTVARFAPALVMSAYGGVLAERFERVRLMVRVDWLCAALMAVMAGLMALGAPAIAVVLVAMLTSSLGPVYQPAAAAMTPQLVPERDLASANALRNTVDNICVIAGPGLGALLLLVADPWLAVLANALTFAVSALLVSAVRQRSEPVDVTEGGQAGPLAQMLVGVRTIGDSTTTAVLVGFSVLATFVYGTDTVLFVVLSEERLGTGPEGYGYLLAGLGVGGVAAAGVVARMERLPRLGPVIVAGLALYCLPTLLFLVMGSPALAFAAQVVRGASTLVVDVLAITALQRAVPSDRLARVFGAFDGLCLLAILVASVLTPVSLHLVGLDVTLWVVGLAVPVLGLAAWPLLARMDAESAGRRAALAPRVRLLSGIGLFAEVREGALEQLAGQAEEVSVPAGTAVVTQGEPADAFYVIESGDLAVSSTGEDGVARELPEMGAGTGFGEIGLIEAIPRTATVTARTDAALLKVSGQAFLAALTADQPSAALLDGASVRLGRTHPGRSLTRAGLAEG